MTISINERLNLVVPVDGDAGTIYVHAMPVSREVFEANFLLVSKTFARVYTEGLGAAAGPRVAKLMMRQVAAELNGADRDGRPNPNGAGTESYEALVAEIRRLASVVAPGPAGWQTYPLQEAVDRKTMSADDLSEVENVLAFFIVASAMHRRSELKEILDGAARLWDAQTTSLNCTDFAASLPTSTEGASSGETGASSGPQ